MIYTRSIPFRILGVKIPLTLVSLSGPTLLLMGCVALSLAWYDVFMTVLEESPWYGLFFFFLISLAIAFPMVVVGGLAVNSVYRGVVDCFLGAREDFTVEIESSNVLIEAPFEGV